MTGWWRETLFAPMPRMQSYSGEHIYDKVVCIHIYIICNPEICLEKSFKLVAWFYINFSRDTMHHILHL